MPSNAALRLFLVAALALSAGRSPAQDGVALPPKPTIPASGVTRVPAGSPAAHPAARKPRHSKKAARDDSEADRFVYGHRPDVVAFAQQVADERGLDRDWVLGQLVGARYEPSVARLVMPPPAGRPKDWSAYRARFLDPQRLRAGVAWWAEHEQDLSEAEARYGVPAEIVAAIVGVETFWGRLTGGYRVLDALSTLAFDFPRGRSDRSEFYRSELRAYLTWCALEGRDADTVRGSYAGAIGWPQFMPSSILRYAVDFDGDGHVDLANGGADVIGSVANFLAMQGWQRGEPLRFDVAPPIEPAARAQLLGPDIVPTFTAAEMTALGAELPDAARGYAGRLALVRLENGHETPSYIAGTTNFYVITRYNWSAYYALAVVDLGAALKRERGFEAAARTVAPEAGSTANR